MKYIIFIVSLLLLASGMAQAQSNYRNSAKVISAGASWSSNATYQHFGVIAEPIVSAYVSNKNMHGTLGFLYNDDVKSLVPPQPAVLIYPPDNTVLSRTPGNPLTISFYWSEQDDVRFHLQVANDADFTDVFVDTNIVFNHFTAQIESDGDFFWRVQTSRGGLLADWSPVWKFGILTTGVEEEQEVEIYPNPADNFIRISLPREFTSGDIEIFDLFGRKRILYHYTSTVNIIYTDKLESGVYFVKILNGRRYITEKMIKQ